MTEKEKLKDAWEQAEKDVKEEIKFLPKGESITIYPSPPPYNQEIEGRYGKQIMQIVNSNIGNLALNRTQFLKVAALFQMQKTPFSVPIRFTKGT